MVRSGSLVNRLSRPALVGGSAATDLVVRFPSDAVAASLSVYTGLFGTALLGTVTTWVMFGVAFYSFGQLPYEAFGDLPRETRAFRGLFAVSAVLMSLAIRQLDSFLSLIAVVIPGTAICGGLLLLLFVVSHNWVLTDPDGPMVELVAVSTPFENAQADFEADLAKDGRRGTVAFGSWLLLVMFLLGLPVLATGFVVQLLIDAFPLPDLAFLGWALLSVGLSGLSVESNRDVLDRDIDIERALLDPLENVIRSVLGLYLTLFVVAGLFIAGGYLLLSVRLAPVVFEVLRLGAGQLGEGLPMLAIQIIWNRVGALIVLVTAGSYLVWVWLRELQRLPYFLDRWEGRQLAPDHPPPRRPTGFVFIPVTGWVITSAFVTVEHRLAGVAYAVAWPVVVVGLLWSVTHTSRRPPQKVSAESVWVIGGLVVQLVGLWLTDVIASLEGVVTGTASVASVFDSPMPFVIGLVLVASVVPFVLRYEAREGGRRFVFVGVLCVVGLFGLVGSMVVPDSFRTASIAIGVAGWVIACVVALSEYVSRSSARE